LTPFNLAGWQECGMTVVWDDSCVGWQMCATTPIFSEMWWRSCKLFCLGWPRNMILPISVSWISRMTDIHPTPSFWLRICLAMLFAQDGL
jgi:hypothetical protein